MVALCNYKSVAEQNSVDIAWSKLMDDKYKDLRMTIYSSDDEMRRFRQLIVNVVMATDIVDKELGALRKKRWEKAFNKDGDEYFDEEARDEVNRKATIVIEVSMRWIEVLLVVCHFEQIYVFMSSHAFYISWQR